MNELIHEHLLSGDIIMGINILLHISFMVHYSLNLPFRITYPVLHADHDHEIGP